MRRLRRERTDLAAKRFLAELKTIDLAKGVFDQKQRTINMLVAEVGGATPTREMRREHFTAVIDDLMEGASYEEARMRKLNNWRARSGLAAGSLNPYRATLRQFVEWCKRENLADWSFDPLYKITSSTRPKGSKIVKLKEAVPLAEWSGLLKAVRWKMHPRDAMFCLMALTQGRRVSELRNLKIGDIDWKRSEIKYTIGKLGHEQRFPFDAATAHYLREYLAWYRDNHGELQPDWYLLAVRVHAQDVWPNPDLRAKTDEDPSLWPLVPTHMASRETLIRVAKAALELHGWTDLKGEGAHAFRRSYAQAMEDLFGREVASAGLGHRPQGTTGKHYTGDKISRKKLDAAVKGQDLFDLLPDPSGSNVVPLAPRRAAG